MNGVIGDESNGNDLHPFDDITTIPEEASEELRAEEESAAGQQAPSTRTATDESEKLDLEWVQRLYI